MDIIKSMSRETILAEAIALSRDERIQLVQDIWDSVAAEPDDLQISDEVKAELDARLEDHLKNPGDVVTWDEVRRGLIKER